MANEAEYSRKTRDDDGGETPEVHHISNPEVAHEKNDVNVGAVIKFTVWLAVATGIVFALMFGLLKAFGEFQNQQEGPPPPLARSEAERLPVGGIRLQGAKGHSFEPEDVTNDPEIKQRLARAEAREELNFELERPMEEWDILRKYQLEELHTYGRDERRPGEFRIPVDRAKELLLQRNQLASRQQQQEQGATTQQSGAAMGQNETEGVQRTEGFDVMPTYQSSGQKAERRRQ